MKFPAKITAILQVGNVRYRRDVLECEKNRPIWDLCAQTLRQALSPEWRASKGFEEMEKVKEEKLEEKCT